MNDDKDGQTILNYDKLNHKIISDSWNVDQERILHLWGTKASGWLWLHAESSRYYNNVNSYIWFPSILILTLASIGNFILASQTDYLSQIFQYIVGSVTISATAAITIQREMRSAEKAELHLHSSKQFSKFIRKIMLELSIRPNDREECSIFTKTCMDEFDHIMFNSLEIPLIVIKKFTEAYPDIYIPEINNGIINFETTDYRSSREAKNEIVIEVKAENEANTIIKARDIAKAKLEAEAKFEENALLEARNIAKKKLEDLANVEAKNIILDNSKTDKKLKIQS